MATGDSGVQLMEINPIQALVFALAMKAARAAGEAAKVGGYPRSSLPPVMKALPRAVLSMVAEGADLTVGQLEDAAEGLGVHVLREVAGPPPMAH
jgi:hypothetical protein